MIRIQDKFCDFILKKRNLYIEYFVNDNHLKRVIFSMSSVAEGDLCGQCAHALSCDQTCERFVCDCVTNYNGTFCDQSKCLVSTKSSSLTSFPLESNGVSPSKSFLSPGCDLA